MAKDFCAQHQGHMRMSNRTHWRSRLGFILAASGSAVGLGNIWKFPYITGENGGGAFVLIYLACIVCVGFPVLVAEILIGRAAEKSPVGAYQTLASRNSPWQVIGWMGVLCAFVILSYYGVVAGWSIYYTWKACFGFVSSSPEDIKATFEALSANPGLNVFLHILFVLTTVTIVGLGVRTGIEKS
ncbi:MAG: sodium-dependent transporter [Pirellulales bacterium]|nr:sodium-dependent transporter [Pirellulales bacterium]